MTMSESDTRSGRRLLNRAAEKRKHGDGGENSLLISPELRRKREENLTVQSGTSTELTSVSISHFKNLYLTGGREKRTFVSVSLCL